MWTKIIWLLNERILFAVALAEGIIALAWLISSLRKRAKARRKKRYRKIEYALPARNNSYIRDRLQTALQTPNRTDDGVYRSEETGLRFGFAQNLVKGLQVEPLTAVERAEVEEMSKILSVCSKKEEWSRGELCVVNDVFMRLLKLSAKYAITD